MNKKYVLMLAIIIVSVAGFIAIRHAMAQENGQNIPIRVLTIQRDARNTDNTTFYKFVDPDNGNVCYATEDFRGGISCVAKN